jgi:hypothetical protein
MKALQVETTSPVPSLAVRPERELSLVPQVPPGERARKLMMEAKAASLEHLEALEAALASARDLAQGVIDGGELYGPGLHEFSRTLAEDVLWRAKTLEALVDRQRKAPAAK